MSRCSPLALTLHDVERRPASHRVHLRDGGVLVLWLAIVVVMLHRNQNGNERNQSKDLTA